MHDGVLNRPLYPNPKPFLQTVRNANRNPFRNLPMKGSPQEHNDRVILADLPDQARKMLEVLDVDGDGYVFYQANTV